MNTKLGLLFLLVGSLTCFYGCKKTVDSVQYCPMLQEEMIKPQFEKDNFALDSNEHKITAQVNKFRGWDIMSVLSIIGKDTLYIKNKSVSYQVPSSKGSRYTHDLTVFEDTMYGAWFTVIAPPKKNRLIVKVDKNTTTKTRELIVFISDLDLTVSLRLTQEVGSD